MAPLPQTNFSTPILINFSSSAASVPIFFYAAFSEGALPLIATLRMDHLLTKIP